MITIGHDAEVFISEGTQIVSAIPYLVGTKEVPEKVNRGAIHSDNVLAELNIDPANSVDEFISNTEAVLNQLKHRIGGRSVVYNTSHHFSRQQLRSFGRQAFEFGCSPDYNCWTDEANRAPSPYTTLRTAGGHIHIGFDEPDHDKQLAVAQMCEYMLGLPSVILDSDRVRRELYGQAGAFRPKPYGIEYRVLSNFWMRSRALQSWVYHNSLSAVERLDELDSFKASVPPHVVQDVINNSDVTNAKDICMNLGISYR